MKQISCWFSLYLWIWVLIFCIRDVIASCNNIEECLIRRLLDNNAYDPRARPLPTFNEDVPVQVIIRLDLYRLIDVDVKQGKITLHSYIYESWLDPRLAWNPADYSNLTSVAVENENLWLPDTTLINAASNSENRPPKGLARVQTLFDPTTGRWSNAQILLSYASIMEPFCYMNTHYFPFDRQICLLTLGSQIRDASKLEFHSATRQVTLERYENGVDGEWTIGDLRMDEEYVFYNCCRLPFSQLSARIVITRKPLFYVINLILPTLITNILATIGLFSNLKVFGGELTAVTVGLTTLLAFSILLLSISEQMPRGSQWISLMGCYFVGIIVQTCVATITAVYLMRNERRHGFKRIFCKPRSKTPTDFRKHNDTDLLVEKSKSLFVDKPAEKQRIGFSVVDKIDEDISKSEESESDRSVENWCMCFHIVFTLTFTVIVLMVGAVNAYVF